MVFFAFVLSFATYTKQVCTYALLYFYFISLHPHLILISELNRDRGQE